MEDLILRLQVEDDHRRGDSAEGVKANVIEGVTTTKTNFQKFKGKKIANKFNKPFAPKGKDFKKINGSCWVCGKPGHKAQDCCHHKDENNTHTNQANINEVDENLVAVVS